MSKTTRLVIHIYFGVWGGGEKFILFIQMNVSKFLETSTFFHNPSKRSGKNFDEDFMAGLQ